MKFIKTTILLFFAFVVSFTSNAQDISNIVAFQENGKIAVKYDLLSMDPSKEFFVKIFSSSDGGKTYGGALNEITGDANKLVKAGLGKVAVWDLMKEASTTKGEFVFRVDAISVGPNGALPSITDRDVSVQFLDIGRSGANVSISLSVANKSQLPFTAVLANFLIVDDQDRICRDFSGDINKVVTIQPGEKKLLNFSIKGVTLNAKSFSQLDFNVGSIGVRLKSVSILEN